LKSESEGSLSFFKSPKIEDVDSLVNGALGTWKTDFSAAAAVDEPKKRDFLSFYFSRLAFD
jgi:hypothetical protein